MSPGIGENAPDRALQGKAYGDVERLKNITSGLKEVGGVVVERGKQGRPPGTMNKPVTANFSAPPQTQQEVDVPQEHLDAMDRFARMKYLSSMADYLTQVPGAGPWIQWYKNITQTQLQDAQEQVRAITPFFFEEQ
jgi:hypothetical protein